MRSWSEHVISNTITEYLVSSSEKEMRETGWHGAVGAPEYWHRSYRVILKLQTDVFLFVSVLCQDIAYIIHEKGISE